MISLLFMARAIHDLIEPKSHWSHSSSSALTVPALSPTCLHRLSSKGWFQHLHRRRPHRRRLATLATKTMVCLGTRHLRSSSWSLDSRKPNVGPMGYHFFLIQWFIHGTGDSWSHWSTEVIIDHDGIRCGWFIHGFHLHKWMPHARAPTVPARL